jgi:HsdM N-terminal domain
VALKKSELYSSLWSSCDELRGGMDASQYKDYVLVLLFIKYVSDKFAGQPFAPITVPEGASLKDMVAFLPESAQLSALEGLGIWEELLAALRHDIVHPNFQGICLPKLVTYYRSIGVG